MQVLFILLCIALLTFLVMKGINMPIAALIVSGVLLILSGLDIYTGYTNTFMTTFGNVFKNYYLMMFLAAFFGKLVEMGGFANTIAINVVDRFGPKYIILTLFIATIVMAYGGINSYVAIFTLYPMAVSMFRKANLPRRLFVIIYVGASCYGTCGAWTVGIHNVTPTKYFGTTLGADGLVFVICSLVVIPFEIIYLNKLAKKYQSKGIGFVAIPEDVEWAPDAKCPNLIVGLLPLAVLLICANALTISVEFAIIIAIIVAVICYWKYLPKKFSAYLDGIKDVLGGVLMMCCSIGSASAFGSIITSTEGYQKILPALTNININPLITVAIIVTVMAGVCASASGGLNVAMPIIEQFANAGVNVNAIHRIACMACTGLDSLPHNGVITALMGYSHTNAKESYGGVFVVSIIFPFIYTALAILIHIVTGTVYM